MGTRYKVPRASGIKGIVSSKDMARLIFGRLRSNYDDWPMKCYDNPAALRSFITLTMGNSDDTSLLENSVVTDIFSIVKYLSSDELEKCFHMQAVAMLKRVYKSITSSQQMVFLL